MDHVLARGPHHRRGRHPDAPVGAAEEPGPLHLRLARRLLRVARLDRRRADRRLLDHPPHGARSALAVPARRRVPLHRRLEHPGRRGHARRRRGRAARRVLDADAAALQLVVVRRVRALGWDLLGDDAVSAPTSPLRPNVRTSDRVWYVAPAARVRHTGSSTDRRRGAGTAPAWGRLVTGIGARDPFVPGMRIGDYRIERELDTEETGVVYLGLHAVLPRRAAVKVMHASAEAAAV